MKRGIGRQTPALALAIAVVALFAALGGSVYAAATRIGGRTIKVNSMPGNRVIVGSLPGNRLRKGSVRGDRLFPGSVTGVQVDASTLDQVPSAAHAETADSAAAAGSALNAANAANAEKLDGHEAGCRPGTRPFAGACWQSVSAEFPATAPDAAATCAAQGGELPEALTLAAFSQQPGIKLAAEGEWSGEIATFTGPNAFSVAIVSATGAVSSALSTETKRYRCVIPLLS
jgi:hypothetical protein